MSLLSDKTYHSFIRSLVARLNATFDGDSITVTTSSKTRSSEMRRTTKNSMSKVGPRSELELHTASMVCSTSPCVCTAQTFGIHCHRWFPREKSKSKLQRRSIFISCPFHPPSVCMYIGSETNTPWIIISLGFFSICALSPFPRVNQESVVLHYIIPSVVFTQPHGIDCATNYC